MIQVRICGSCCAEATKHEKKLIPQETVQCLGKPDYSTNPLVLNPCYSYLS